MGRGGDEVVIVLAFYSDDPSTNLLKPTVFSAKYLFLNDERKQKEAGVGQLFKKRFNIFKGFIPYGTLCALQFLVLQQKII